MSISQITKPLFLKLGISRDDIFSFIGRYSINGSLKQQSLKNLFWELKKIEPDISDQISSETETFSDFWDLKRRAQQAFQVAVTLDTLKSFEKKNVTVVDIGDSSGRHLHYLKTILKDKKEIRGIGVNLDERAIPKIRSRGIEAIHSRAEDLQLSDSEVDLFISFEMLEHLHSPALFLRKLALSKKSTKLLVTVPYRRRSQVGLDSVRRSRPEPVRAETEHIFELSPEDWELLFLHSGWRLKRSKIYFQYPTKIPILSSILKWFWRTFDFEGFWAAELRLDLTVSDRYLDWET